MVHNFIDIYITIIQGLLMCYTMTCTSKKREIIENILMFIVFFVINYFLINVTRNFYIATLLWHVILLFFIFIIYKSDFKSKITYCSIFYICNTMFYLVILNILNIYVGKIKCFENDEIIIWKTMLLLYTVFALIYTYYIKKICYIYNNEMESGNGIIAASFIVESIFCQYNSGFRGETALLIEFTLISGQVFMLLTAIYFFRIYEKAQIIFELNKQLEVKNIELKNIKDKHANIVSYMKELYEEDNKDQIGIILKDIINGNENVIEENRNTNKLNNSILDIALKNAQSKGIKINIKQEYDISFSDMNGLELYRIITNIVNNAVRVLKNQEEKIINIRTYKEMKNIIIEIENNGPKIEREFIKKIFESGFTTKVNKDSSHGYGLSIVKELIENSNGKIEVNSTELFTTFKIVLPIK